MGYKKVIMNNPFEVLDKRLSMIEELLLDIKHDLTGKIPKKNMDFYQVLRDRKINIQTYNALCHVHKVKTINDFLDLPLREIKRTRGIGNLGYKMCIEAKEYYANPK